MAAVASPSSTACLCPPSSKFQNPLSRYALPLAPIPRKLRPLHISNSSTSDRYAPEEPRNGAEVLVDSIPMAPITGQAPRRCIVQVIDELTSGSVGVVEHHQMWGAQHYKYIRPPQWLTTSGGLGGMGTARRINPLGFRVGSFRLGTTQTHHSIWFQHPKKYSEELEEDTKIRNCIKKYPGFEGVARIQIHKRIDLTEIMIYMGFPESALGGDRTRKMEELQLAIQKRLNSGNRKLSISVTKIAKPYADPNILAEFIAGQLTKRVQFRKAMKKAIELTEQAGAKGIQVQIGGRLDGKEIARVEWMREGRVPLQTIRAKIEYCSYPVRTIHGVLGIKVWIYTDEE